MTVKEYIDDDIKKLKLYLKLCDESKKQLNQYKRTFGKEPSYYEYSYMKDDLMKLAHNKSDFNKHLARLDNDIIKLRSDLIIIDKTETDQNKKIEQIEKTFEKLNQKIKKDALSLKKDVVGLKNTISNMQTINIVKIEFDKLDHTNLDQTIKNMVKLEKEFNNNPEHFEHFGQFKNEDEIIEYFINDIVNGVKNKILNPIKDVAEQSFNKVKSGVASSVNVVKDQVSNVGNSIKGIGEKIGSEVKGKFDVVKDGITKGFNSVKSGVNEVKNQTVKIGDEIGKQATRISSTVISAVTEQFNQIKDFFVSFGNKITDIFKIIIKKFEELGGQITKIANIVANFGKDFYNKFLKPLFNEIFGAMKYVFEFIKDYIIPFLKNIIEFVIKYVPQLIKRIGELTVRYFKNYSKTFLIAWVIFILVFFGIQVYMNLLLDISLPIPHIVLIGIAGLIMFDQVMNNVENLEYYQNEMKAIIVKIFSSDNIKKLLKLSPQFGKNVLKSFGELVIHFTSNMTTYIFGFMFGLLLIKYLAKYTIDKFRAYL
jgi:phage-related protein